MKKRKMCDLENCRGCEYEKARETKNELLNWLGVVYIVLLVGVAFYINIVTGL